jgi:hypothetical protein
MAASSPRPQASSSSVLVRRLLTRCAHGLRGPFEEPMAGRAPTGDVE